METVKEVVSYAKTLEKEYRKRFNFTITTNALLLDDNTINYLHKNMDNVVLSLDGRKMSMIISALGLTEAGLMMILSIRYKKWLNSEKGIKKSIMFEYLYQI